MRVLAGLIALVFAAACSAASVPEAQSQTPAPIETQAPPQATHPDHEMREPIRPLSLRCAGALVQGGTALCRTEPGDELYLGDEMVGRADADGWVVIGFPREAPGTIEVTSRRGSQTVSNTLTIAPREFDIQRVDGLPPQTVTPTDPEVLARIRREAALKQQGFASNAPLHGWTEGFIMPVEGRVSGRWGNQRILNGVPSTPHFGYDIAAPEGTAIRAPASGVVTLAEPDMHYEGGLVFIDHGQGLITMYLHMSRLDVRVGDSVAQGQVIGAVGARGRATGPHLCWRMKWRERQLDPSVAVDGLAVARAALLSHEH